MEIERLRADLRQISFQRETAFARLHEKRAGVIEGLYNQLLQAEAATRFLLTPIRYADDPPDKERERQAEVATHESYRYYRENRLYFDLHLCRLLEDFDEKLMLARVDHAVSSEDDPETAIERRATQYKAWKTLSDEIPPILREIEKEFRTLLGNEPVRQSQKS